MDKELKKERLPFEVVSEEELETFRNEKEQFDENCMILSAGAYVREKFNVAKCNCSRPGGCDEYLLNWYCGYFQLACDLDLISVHELSEMTHELTSAFDSRQRKEEIKNYVEMLVMLLQEEQKLHKENANSDDCE